MRWEDWRSRLWPLPALGVAVAVGLGVLLPRVDVAVAAHLPPALAGHLFSGGPEAARTVLSAIAGSLITVSALTFSLTVVTLQLAASQFSPRLLRTFTRDPAVQVTLALLIGTFTYAVMVLRTVRSDTQTQAAFVPQLSVTLAFVLGLIAFVTLIAFLAHLVRQIRIELLLQRVTAETTATMHRLREDRRHDQGQPPAAAPGAAPVPARRTGFLVAVDDTALLKAAVDAGAVISLDRRVGDWLIEGTPIAHTWPATPAPEADPAADEDLAAALDQALTIGPERTAAQDIAFGLRQLTEVAVKALSPGINDPTTAVHALHHTSALLCGLARQPPALACSTTNRSGRGRSSANPNSRNCSTWPSASRDAMAPPNPTSRHAYSPCCAKSPGAPPNRTLTTRYASNSTRSTTRSAPNSTTRPPNEPGCGACRPTSAQRWPDAGHPNHDPVRVSAVATRGRHSAPLPRPPATDR
ncbi:DUF2254 domain-containing protein [Catellatospora coxensis]